MDNGAHGSSGRSTSSFEAEMARRQTDRERERRWLRLGLLAAAVVHVGVFAAHWPTVVKATGPVDDERLVVYRLQPVELRPPDRRPLDVTVPRARPVPVPDPSPLDPEPLERPVERVVEHDLDLDQLVLGEVVPPTPDPPPPAEVIVGVHVAPPEVVHRVLPRYPEAAQRIKLDGAVIVELLIDPRGDVERATVLRGMPMGLSESALEAVRQWRFRPSTIDGRPVSVRYVLTVHFRLE